MERWPRVGGQPAFRRAGENDRQHEPPRRPDLPQRPAVGRCRRCTRTGRVRRRYQRAGRLRRSARRAPPAKQTLRLAQGRPAMGADLNTGFRAVGAGPALGSPAAAYGPLAALFYDADQPFAGAQELAWYRTRLPKNAGAILEAMAGSGRVLVPLTDEG